MFRTYFINNRGDEVFVNTWSFLDMTALGRQEDVGGLPGGLPADPNPTNGGTGTTNTANSEPSRWFGEPDPDDPTTNDRRVGPEE